LAGSNIIYNILRSQNQLSTLSLATMVAPPPVRALDAPDALDAPLATLEPLAMLGRISRDWRPVLNAWLESHGFQSAMVQGAQSWTADNKRDRALRAIAFEIVLRVLDDDVCNRANPVQHFLNGMDFERLVSAGFQP
jgi:hypothetical protein